MLVQNKPKYAKYRKGATKITIIPKLSHIKKGVVTEQIIPEG